VTHAITNSATANTHSRREGKEAQHDQIRRTALGLTASVALALMSWCASAASGSVTCTIFVGGKLSYSQTYELDENDSGRERLFFEANMFNADVDIAATNGQIEVGMTLTRRGMDFSDEIVFGILRGTAQMPTSKTISVVNSDLVCEIG
jgi:hypothetical protein